MLPFQKGETNLSAKTPTEITPGKETNSYNTHHKFIDRSNNRNRKQQYLFENLPPDKRRVHRKMAPRPVEPDDPKSKCSPDNLSIEDTLSKSSKSLSIGNNDNKLSSEHSSSSQLSVDRDGPENNHSPDNLSNSVNNKDSPSSISASSSHNNDINNEEPQKKKQRLDNGVPEVTQQDYSTKFTFPLTNKDNKYWKNLSQCLVTEHEGLGPFKKHDMIVDGVFTETVKKVLAYLNTGDQHKKWRKGRVSDLANYIQQAMGKSITKDWLGSCPLIEACVKLSRTPPIEMLDFFDFHEGHICKVNVHSCGRKEDSEEYNNGEDQSELIITWSKLWAGSNMTIGPLWHGDTEAPKTKDTEMVVLDINFAGDCTLNPGIGNRYNVDQVKKAIDDLLKWECQFRDDDSYYASKFSVSRYWKTEKWLQFVKKAHAQKLEQPLEHFIKLAHSHPRFIF
jgi:hypothetical protein